MYEHILVRENGYLDQIRQMFYKLLILKKYINLFLSI